MFDLRVTNPTQTDSATEFVFGKARNIVTQGDNTGTPWNAFIINNTIFGPLSAILYAADIAPNGTEEKAGQSQVLTALRQIVQDYSWGDKFVGKFAKGFTYTAEEQVARHGNSYYLYVGSDTLPKTVIAGTDPSSDSDFEAVKVKDVKAISGLRNELDDRAAYLTLAEAQAKDLSTGSYVFVKDRNNPLCLVVGGTVTEDVIATLANGNKLQVQPRGSAVFVEWFGASTSSNSAAAIETAIKFADKHKIKFVDGYGIFPVDDGQIDVSLCENVNIRVDTRKTVANERTFYCANGTSMAWEKAEHYGANDYDGTQRNSVAIELDSCTNTKVRLCDFDKFGDASVRYRECDGLKIERTTTQGPDNITTGDNFSFGVRSYNQVNGSKDVELSFNEVTGTATAYFGSGDENTILQGNISRGTLGQHGYYYEPKGKFTAMGNQAISPALVGAKVQIQASSEIGETHRSILLDGFIVTDHAGGVGVEVNVASGATEFYEDLSITNCVCSNGQTGINGENILRGNVSNNVVSGMSAYGIFLEKFEGIANDNVIHDTGWASLAFESMQGTCHASGNNISKFATAGDTSVGIRRAAIYASGVQHLHLSGNTVTRDGSTALYSVASPNSLLHFDGGNNLPKDAPIDVGNRDNIQTLDDSKRGIIRVGGVSLPLPTTLKQGKGHREFHGPAIPSSSYGYFFQGDIVWNTDTSVGQPMYWRCVVSGTPGTWEAFDVRT